MAIIEKTEAIVPKIFANFTPKSSLRMDQINKLIPIVKAINSIKCYMLE